MSDTQTAADRTPAQWLRWFYRHSRARIPKRHYGNNRRRANVQYRLDDLSIIGDTRNELRRAVEAAEKAEREATNGQEASAELDSLRAVVSLCEGLRNQWLEKVYDGGKWADFKDAIIPALDAAKEAKNDV